jgi:hypothetical protein
MCVCAGDPALPVCSASVHACSQLRASFELLLHAAACVYTTHSRCAGGCVSPLPMYEHCFKWRPHCALPVLEDGNHGIGASQRGFLTSTVQTKSRHRNFCLAASLRAVDRASEYPLGSGFQRARCGCPRSAIHNEGSSTETAAQYTSRLACMPRLQIKTNGTRGGRAMRMSSSDMPQPARDHRPEGGSAPSARSPAAVSGAGARPLPTRAKARHERADAPAPAAAGPPAPAAKKSSRTTEEAR